MTETLTLGKALNIALRGALEDNPKVLILGEDVGQLGGVFRITDGLQKDFGEDRVIDTPLGESGIIGTAIGLALRGYRPVCEIQFDGFVYPAFDQIVSQLSRLHYRSAGLVRLPITVRIPYGGGIGAVEHHSESPEAYFCHTPGLKVVTCSSPADGYAMVRQAIDCDDPVIFFEPKRRYWEKGEVDIASAAADDLFTSRVLQSGADCTVVAYGPMVRVALDAAEADDKRSLEVIDLRTLAPLDLAPVYESVRRTGRLVVVHEAARTLGVGAEVAASVAEECFYSLEAPVQRVTAFDTPYPPARLEEDYLPDLNRVLDAVDHTFSY